MPLLAKKTAEILEKVHRSLEIPLDGYLADPSGWLTTEIQFNRRHLETVDVEAMTEAFRQVETAWNAVNRARREIRRILCRRAPELDGIEREAESERLPVITTAETHSQRAA